MLPLLDTAARRATGESPAEGLWQKRQDCQQHHQRDHPIYQPQGCGVLPQQVGAQCQQPGQQDTQSRPGKNQGAQAWAAGGQGQRLAKTGNHHQGPGTGHAGTKAQYQMRPEPVSPVRRQGQKHT